MEKWGDVQQYRAEPHGSYAGPESGVVPEVTLLWMTPDPLGAVGAMAAMYEGRVVRDLAELSHEDRMRYWKDVRATHLDTPLEAIQFHFLLEGVDRSFTHQLVRKRVGTAFAQESLRFAVPGSLETATSLPPSLQGSYYAEEDVIYPVLSGAEQQRQDWRDDWDAGMRAIDQVYHRLVASGMPAEEARGLLPHATATRVHYLVNLRSLLQEAGNRLCTQAQWHWKMVMVQIVNAIRHYPTHGEAGLYEYEGSQLDAEFSAIADEFKPVCYELGRCPFKASFDRECTIRERVDANAAHGVPSAEWERSHEYNVGQLNEIWIGGIRPEEWLLNPGAARKTR